MKALGELRSHVIVNTTNIYLFITLTTASKIVIYFDLTIPNQFWLSVESSLLRD